MLDIESKESTMTPRERSNANLRPIQPGVSGNPLGRPPGIPDRRRIAKEFAAMEINAKHVDGKESVMTAEQAYMASLYRKAIGGDVPAIKELQDTLHGKIVEESNVTVAADIRTIERIVKDPKNENNS